MAVSRRSRRGAVLALVAASVPLAVPQVASAGPARPRPMPQPFQIVGRGARQTVVPAPALQRTISRMFPGYRVPPPNEFAPGFLKGHQEQYGTRTFPGACSGDFDGDGRRDAALLLVGPRHRYLVAAFRQRPDGSFGAWCLYGRGDEGRDEGYDTSGKLIVYLCRERKGLHDYLEIDDDDLRPARMRLAHDAIAVVWVGSAAHLYFVRAGRYHQVWTAD